MPAQKPKPKSKRPSPRVKVNVGQDLLCAEFVGGDKTTNTTTNTITYGFSTHAVEQLILKVLAFLKAGAMFAPAGLQSDLLRAEVDGESLTFRPGAVHRLAGGRNERSYLLSLTVRREYQMWATKFIPLAAQMDVRREPVEMPMAFTEFIVPPPGAGPEAQPRTEALVDITQALNKHTAFVILGEPGAGKTTTQQKIAFESARTLLAEGVGRVPLFVRLSQQAGRTPFEFLRAEWEQHTGADLADALAAGRVLLLADGLNELPRDDRADRLKAWRLFAEEHAGHNQIVFSGRERDYETGLSLPRVRVEPLDDDRIADYLQRNQAEGLADLLDDSRAHLREMARNPFNLSLLVFAYQSNQRETSPPKRSGAGMGNRGALLSWFVSQLFAREEQLAHPRWIPRAVQTQALAQLAFTMQAQGESTTLTHKVASAAVPTTLEWQDEELALKPADLFRFARAATLLDPATAPQVRFYHHLLQEYFAALELLRRFEAGEELHRLWAAHRLENDMPPANVGEWEALPEPPGTGWEVTTILACGLARDPAKLIDTVRLHNPTLAGRCLHEAGITLSDDSPSPDRERLGQGTRQRMGGGVLRSVRADLLAELYNPTVHLRARLQAGYTLGHIGDPRFEAQVLNGVKVIVPQTLNVPAGHYAIGSDESDKEAFDNERPQTTLDLLAFAMGKWPVTNAEYACFMDAGGYKDEQWWKTDLAKRWLKGEDVMGGQSTTILQNVKLLQSIPNWKEQLEATGSFSPQDLEAYESLITLDEDELKAKLSEQLSNKSRIQPEWWNDSNRNNPSQPVVGITWFEANAYCEWLSAITDRTYRLPTEAEWEVAVRGPQGRRYPWGDEWEQAKANTIEGRVLKPSPVGAYTAVGNVGPFGGEDQSGNVWNWTSSLYVPYPYHADDGHEDPSAERERVVRGGSWYYFRRTARCAYRGRDVPEYFYNGIGFRVSSPGSYS